MQAFTTTVDEETKGYVLTRVGDGNSLTVRINANTADPENAVVIFEECPATLTGEEFDDLNVRVRAARMWLVRAQGNLDTMRALIKTI